MSGRSAYSTLLSLGLLLGMCNGTSSSSSETYPAVSLKLLGFAAEEDGGGGVHHHLKCNLALLPGFAPPFELPLSPPFELLNRPPFEADLWSEIGGIASPLSSVPPWFFARCCLGEACASLLTIPLAAIQLL